MCCVLRIFPPRNRTIRTSTFDRVRRTLRPGIPTRRRTAISCRCNCCPRAGRVSGAWTTTARTRGRLTTVQPWRFHCRRSMLWVFVPWRRLFGSCWRADGRLFSLIYRCLEARDITHEHTHRNPRRTESVRKNAHYCYY